MDRIIRSQCAVMLGAMTLRQLIQPDDDWLDAPTSRRVLRVALAACAGLAVYGFTVMALVSFLLFGFVLGCFAKHEQLWAAPVKIVAGLLFSGVICFPSFYIFSTLAGARVSISQLAACLAGALALAGLLLLEFAPAVWIFAESTTSTGKTPPPAPTEAAPSRGGRNPYT
jgi:hypothetical protein